MSNFVFLGEPARYRLAFFLVIFFLLFSPSIFAKDPSVHYQIDAAVDVVNHQIEAKQKVFFFNQSETSVDEVYFHLYPNRYYTPDEITMLMRYAGYFKVDPYPTGFVQGDMPVHSVRLDKRELNFFIEGKDKTLLKVLLPVPLAPKETIVLEVNFSVRIPHAYGRFGWHENVIKAAYWYPILCAQTADGWAVEEFYPFHRPFYTDAAHYEVVLTVPDDYTVIHSGNMVAEEQQGPFKKIDIKTDFPIRAFSFAMSPDYQWKEAQYRDVMLRCYYLPGDDRRAQKAVENLKDVFAFYEKYIGPYPYKKFSVAPVHLGYGGEQMANMIFIDTRVFRLPKLLEREFDFLVAHEAGHQWFYNMIGVNGLQALWLEEAINSYFSLQYIEGKYGYDADILEFPQWFQSYRWIFPRVSFRRARDYRYQSEARMSYDGSLDSSLEAYDDPSRIFSLVYGKGVRVIEALREEIGEDAFVRVFQRAAETYRFQNWTGKDFLALCEQESGKTLKGFFNQWIFSGGYCDYAVRANGRRVILNRKGGVSQPVTIQVVFADESIDEFLWEGKEERKDFYYSQDIRKVTVDPKQRVFDLDRTDNSWPRLVQWSLVPLYVGLYDIPLFLSDDAYHVVMGPEVRDGVGIKASFQKPYDYVFYGGINYRLGEDLWTSRIGFLKKNVMRRSISFGTELSRTEDLDTGREDLTSGKIYMRKDFDVWPYGMFTVQDHASLYLMRNQRLNADNEAIHSSDDDRNVEYKRGEETIIGLSFHRDRSAPYPDPKQGYRMNVGGEYAGHMLGGQQYFYRGALDMAFYQPVTSWTKLASRVKIGMGYPNDKDLFQLGGIDGLRGYQRKSLRGANAALGVMEYRFPLLERLNYYAADNILGLQRIDAGVFAEAGCVWFSSYAESAWKKDAGISVRFHINIGGFLEKVIVSVDAAQAIDDSDQSTHFWLSVNSLF